MSTGAPELRITNPVLSSNKNSMLPPIKALSDLSGNAAAFASADATAAAAAAAAGIRYSKVY